MTRRHARLTFLLLTLWGAGCGSDEPEFDTAGGPSVGQPGGVGGGGTTGGGAGNSDAAAPSQPTTPGATSDAGAGTGGGSRPDATVADTGSSSGGAAGGGSDSGSVTPPSEAGVGTDATIPPGDGGAPASSAGKLPRVTTTDGVGPFKEVVKVKSTPPGGWLIYPKEIGKDGIKHPLFVFGPGGGTTPQTYEQMGMHWDRYGSYGFVIYVLPQSTGDGAAMKAGLDWLIKQNTESSSPLFGKLDTTKVCAAGHSMGSVTTFDFMPDDRVTTTIHISGGSFDGMGPSNLKNDTMFLCGPSGSADTATPQCETDFENSKVPTYYTKIEGSTHLTSGRLGWASIIAWMLWHLADQEDQWKKEFLEPTGKFQMGIYKSQIKNWP